MDEDLGACVSRVGWSGARWEGRSRVRVLCARLLERDGCGGAGVWACGWLGAVGAAWFRWEGVGGGSVGGWADGLVNGGVNVWVWGSLWVRGQWGAVWYGVCV